MNLAGWTRRVLVLPDLVSGGGESVLRGSWPGLGRLVERGRVWRLREEEGGGVREAAWLGMAPESVGLAQGPLTVSALGADPPERSVHFHLSLMSLGQDGVVGTVPGRVSDEDARVVMEAAARLATRKLTPVAGEGVDHGLVWEEGSLDLGVVSAGEAVGRVWGEVLPEGDGERLLRGFIDDSVNLLSGLEMNRRRAGEGLDLYNLLWPWGFGFRERLPNLALRRGEVVEVRSGSLRLAGLSRLVGYRHGPRRGFLRGMQVSEGVLRGFGSGRGGSEVLVLETLGEMRRHERVDEVAYTLGRFDKEVFSRWADWGEEDGPLWALVLAPGFGGGDGLALEVVTGAVEVGRWPFDERVLEERGVGLRREHELAGAALGDD